MNNLKATIVDDEPSCSSRLQNLIEKNIPDIQIISVCHSVEDGLKSIAENKPHILFLDIELPDGTGFDLVTKLEEPEPEIIFTTAYDKYALRAIKLSAVDYLLKPVSADELLQAVNKARIRLSKNIGQPVALLKQTLFQELNKIALPTGDGYRIVSINDIIRCEADSNYTRVILISAESILVSKTLREFDEMLSPLLFCRIHHTHLINLRQAVKYIKGEGGYVIMSDKSSIEVSKRKKEVLLQQLQRV